MGCFEGFVYLLPGKGDGEFDPPERIKDSAGKDVHLGQFWNYEKKKWDEGREGGMGNLGVYPDLVDWDGDGDLDLLFGGYQGQVGVRLNEGTASKPSFVTKTVFAKVGDSPLKMTGAVSAEFVDWDGDGLNDLVCGTARGRLQWFKNLGPKANPSFAKGKDLVEIQAGQPSSYLRVSAGDFNGDEKIDLIVGAYDGRRKPAIWVYLRE